MLWQWIRSLRVSPKFNYTRFGGLFSTAGNHLAGDEFRNEPSVYFVRGRCFLQSVAKHKGVWASGPRRFSFALERPRHREVGPRHRLKYFGVLLSVSSEQHDPSGKGGARQLDFTRLVVREGGRDRCPDFVEDVAHHLDFFRTEIRCLA